jgi:hypothetical protein
VGERWSVGNRSMLIGRLRMASGEDPREQRALLRWLRKGSGYSPTAQLGRLRMALAFGTAPQARCNY